MKVALAGLPLSGKTALFDALSNHAVDSQARPARADHPNVAAVKVPDERVDWLSETHGSAKIVHATIELVDLPGLVIGDAQGAADRPRILAHLRQAEAVVICLRAFDSAAIPPRGGRVDPRRDYNDLYSEFLVADLDSVMRRIEKIDAVLTKPLPKAEKDGYKHEHELLGRCQAALEAERSLREVIRTPDDAALVRGFGFFTLKPAVVVLNVDESHAADPAEPLERFGQLDVPVYAICAGAESEILRLDPAERPDFLADLGLQRLQSDQLARNIFNAVDQIVFLTTGPDESRAWPVPAGTRAVDAAGEIHSDLSRGFIRAEVISYTDLREAGSEKAARAAGKLRLEGKDYIVQDGDVMTIRFSA